MAIAEIARLFWLPELHHLSRWGKKTTTAGYDCGWKLLGHTLWFRVCFAWTQAIASSFPPLLIQCLFCSFVTRTDCKRSTHTHTFHGSFPLEETTFLVPPTSSGGMWGPVSLFVGRNLVGTRCLRYLDSREFATGGNM